MLNSLLTTGIATCPVLLNVFVTLHCSFFYSYIIYGSHAHACT